MARSFEGTIRRGDLGWRVEILLDYNKDTWRAYLQKWSAQKRVLEP